MDLFKLGHYPYMSMGKTRLKERTKETGGRYVEEKKKKGSNEYPELGGGGVSSRHNFTRICTERKSGKGGRGGQNIQMKSIVWCE